MAEEVTVASGMHPDGVNTPRFLTGRMLRLWNLKLKFQRLVLLLSGIMLTGLVFVQVITRYFFGISLFGIEELATFSAIFMYFFGMSHGAWERGHISASLVELVLPAGRPQLFVEALALVITVVLAGWMTTWTWDYLGFVIRRGTVSLETDIPMYWIVAVLPICMFLMTVYFLVEAGQRVHALISGRALT